MKIGCDSTDEARKFLALMKTQRLELQLIVAALDNAIRVYENTTAYHQILMEDNTSLYKQYFHQAPLIEPDFDELD